MTVTLTARTVTADAPTLAHLSTRAARYTYGGRAAYGVTRLHTFDSREGRTLCGRFALAQLIDPLAREAPAIDLRPTCVKCRRLDRRLRIDGTEAPVVRRRLADLAELRALGARLDATTGLESREVLAEVLDGARMLYAHYAALWRERDEAREACALARDVSAKTARHNEKLAEQNIALVNALERHERAERQKRHAVGAQLGGA